MDLRYVDAAGVHDHGSDDVVELLLRDDGFVWVDVPSWDDEVENFLAGLGCHPMVVAACRQRNHVPTVHAYPDHWFVTMHTPLLGRAGHVHLLELDMVVSPRYLVTVHGPLEVAYALGSAVARRQRGLIGDVAEKIPELEQRVMAPQLKEPEALLERMFLVRHELITGRTMAAQTHDVCARVASLDRFVGEEDRALARDLADQFDRVRSIGDGESLFLFGVIELYQTRVNTKMTVAMERLAVIAAVTLPVTAIASVYGMNMIVSRSTHFVELGVVLLVMLAMSAQLLRWARRQGWW